MISTTSHNTKKPIRKKRNEHPEFISYMKKIRDHANYQGMPELQTSNWVCTNNSDIGKKRKDWMRTKMKIHNIPDERGAFQKIALLIHPFKKKPCKICGKEMFLNYVYPNKKFVEKLKKYGINADQLTPINSVLADITQDPKSLQCFKKDCGIECSNTVESALKKLQEGNYLSPGAMSNFPDRLDGYHSYNKCCRSKHDRGRHPSNMEKYTEDRRAYEYWSDGDWKAADDVMAYFRKQKISPDHIGPISLGFCHRPEFNEMTLKENIMKRNTLRMTDIRKLISDESDGDCVVSWHSKHIWDTLKKKPNDDDAADKVGKLMRNNLHHVMHLLYGILKNNNEIFLEEYMNLHYADFKNNIGYDDEKHKITIEKLSVRNEKREIVKKRRKKNMIRALKEYAKKTNRQQRYWFDLNPDVEYINEGILISNDEGKKRFDTTLIKLARHALKKYQ